MDNGGNHFKNKNKGLYTNILYTSTWTLVLLATQAHFHQSLPFEMS